MGLGKTINVDFETEEHKALKNEKRKLKLDWRKFIMFLFNRHKKLEEMEK